MYLFHSTGSQIFNFNTKWNASYSSMFYNKTSKTDLHSRKMNIKMPGSERQMLHGVANTLDLDLKKKKKDRVFRGRSGKLFGKRTGNTGRGGDMKARP